MGSVTLNGQPLYTVFGLALDGDPRWLSGPVVRRQRQPLSDHLGALFSRRPQYEPRPLQLAGTLMGASVSDRETREGRLLAALHRGLVRIGVDTGTVAVEAWGYPVGQPEIAPWPTPTLYSLASRVTIRLECPDACWSETGILPYGFGAIGRALPLWTAPVAPLWRLQGPATGTAVSPVLTVSNAAGTTLSATTFGLTLAVGDWVEADPVTGRTEKNVSGTRSDAYSVVSGDRIPILDPVDGDETVSAYPRAQVSAGAVGVALYGRRRL